MQHGSLCLAFATSLLFASNISANQVSSDTYLLDWLKNSEHYAQEKVASKESPGAIIFTPTLSAQAAQKIVAVLGAVCKHDVKHVQQETINALEASNLIASKGGSTQRTALGKLCQHTNPTLLGKISLADMLVHSSADLELIRSRQELIQALCNNDELREKLVSLTDTYAKSLDSMHMFQHQILAEESVPSVIKGRELVGTGKRLSFVALLKYKSQLICRLKYGLSWAKYINSDIY